jgi:predicted nucleic acid-binding protein
MVMRMRTNIEIDDAVMREAQRLTGLATKRATVDLALREPRSRANVCVTIRKTLDCLIAAPCVRTGAPLLHADAAFDRLASCTDLRIHRV